jgi:hypothetical protein
MFIQKEGDGEWRRTRAADRNGKLRIHIAKLLNTITGNIASIVELYSRAANVNCSVPNVVFTIRAVSPEQSFACS